MSEQQVVSISKRDDVVVAVVQQAEMDEEATGKMQAEVLAGTEQAGGLPVALDLSNVSFFPSLSLGAIVTVLKTLKARGRGSSWLACNRRSASHWPLPAWTSSLRFAMTWRTFKHTCGGRTRPRVNEANTAANQATDDCAFRFRITAVKSSSCGVSPTNSRSPA